MDKVVELHPDGRAIVNMGFGETSVEARNFFAQIAQLVKYDGPDSEEITFLVTAQTIRQAAGWGIDRREMLRKIRFLSGQYPVRVVRNRFHWRAWTTAAKTKESQEQGIYSAGLSGRVGFWSRLRRIQTLWMLRGFNKQINVNSLPKGLRSAIYSRERSWADLVRYAGFDPEEEAFYVRRESWSRREVLSRIQSLKQSGSPIHVRWLQLNGYGNLWAAIRREFGSWRAAILAAGLNPEDEWRGGPERLAPEMVLSEIIRRNALGEKLNPKVVRVEYHNLYASGELHFGSWAEALEAAGLDPTEVFLLQTWTPESIISSLRELKEVGEPLNERYLRISYSRLNSAMKTHFGSWAEAIKAAGFDPDAERLRREWNREEIVEELISIKERGEPINVGYLQKNYSELGQAIYRHFDSWDAAVEAAGFNPDEERPIEFWNVDKIITRLQAIKAAGEPLNRSYIRAHYRSLDGAMDRYFSPWVEAIKAAGFDPDIERVPFKNWDKTRITQEITDLKRRGESLSSSSLRKNHNNLLNAMREYFGSWEEAIRAAGLDPNEERVHREWSRDEIIKELRRRKQNGERINFSALPGEFVSAAETRFGSWEEAVRAAGFDPDEERSHQKWSREKIIKQIRELKNQGKPIYRKALPQALSDAAIRYFGSWAEAIRESGFDPIQEAYRSNRAA